jgi:hypothetical protein
MNGKVKVETYDLSKDYKALPVKKRVRLIMIARTLLKIQKENTVTLAVASSCEKQGYASVRI